MACLGWIISSLALNVIRQRASEAPLVPKNIRAPLAYGIASIGPGWEGAAYYDCQPSAPNLTPVCTIPLASSRSTRRECPMTAQPTGEYHEHGKPAER
ncbi:hypothetical protein EDB85DRAFT_1926303 [Lactarius pseudohatsudake]|nr:hypothetical protein EDB85DRAFT_1926303 [Lactarius pseudohatsudake]